MQEKIMSVQKQKSSCVNYRHKKLSFNFKILLLPIDSYVHSPNWDCKLMRKLINEVIKWAAYTFILSAPLFSSQICPLLTIRKNTCWRLFHIDFSELMSAYIQFILQVSLRLNRIQTECFLFLLTDTLEATWSSQIALKF